MVPKGNVIAEVDGVLNAVSIDADTMPLTLMGPGAGGKATTMAAMSAANSSAAKPAQITLRACA